MSQVSKTRKGSFRFLSEEPPHLGSMRQHCMVLSSSVMFITLLVLHIHAKDYTLTPSRRGD